MNSSTLRYDFKWIRERDVQSIFEKNYRSLFKRIQKQYYFFSDSCFQFIVHCTFLSNPGVVVAAIIVYS